MKLQVLLVSDQVRGIDGTGGLGDVATGLAKELARRPDTEIRLLMPGYQQISEKKLERRFDDVVHARLPVEFGAETLTVSISKLRLPKFQTHEPDVWCYLVQQPQQFDRRRNSGAQAILLAKATLAFLRAETEFRPDVVHCNDWHTGLIPVYLNTLLRRDPHLGRVATLYTTHNNSGWAYQGAKSYPEVRHLAGLPDALYHPGRTASVEHFGHFNFAKGGIAFADLVNTVSLSYADELRTQAFGGTLESVVNERAHDFCGIVNGIDVHEWDPAEDRDLPAACRFGVHDDLDTIIARKRQVRGVLREAVDDQGRKPFDKLRDDSILIGVVTRIADQKMPLLVPLPEDGFGDHASPLGRLAASGPDVQFVILGNADKSDDRGLRYVGQLERLQGTFPGRILFLNGFIPAVAHQICAASELFLVPSVYEPCGLTQLSAMRYASVPVVRQVGGLADTVVDERHGGDATGFTFLERAAAVETWSGMYDGAAGLDACTHALRRALDVYRNPVRWRQLMANCLARDSSWSVAAGQYRKLYARAVERRVDQMFVRPGGAAAALQEFSQWRAQIERLWMLPPIDLLNLRKLDGAGFGPYDLTPEFRQRLSDLAAWGWISLTRALDDVPPRGENLSFYIQLTAEGRQFLRQRTALEDSLRA